MIKVGLVGFGFAAQTFHLPLLKALPEYEIVAVSSRYPDTISKELPNAKVYENYLQLLADSEIDLVVITAPNDLHFSIAKEALEHNKHVVLEKPMTTNPDDAEFLIGLADKVNKKFTVFHNRRWDGDFKTVKSLIQDGQLGEVKVLESHFDRFRPNIRPRWREQPGDGAGIWFDLGPHLVDQVFQLFGLPSAVTAKCLALRDDSEVCDYFHVQLHYDNKEVILNSSPYCAHPNKRFEIQGSKGSLTLSGLDAQEQHLKDSISPLSESFGVNDQVQSALLFDEQGSREVDIQRGDYLQFYNLLLKAIVNGDDLPINPTEIKKVIRLIKLAEKSSAEGRTLHWS